MRILGYFGIKLLSFGATLCCKKKKTTRGLLFSHAFVEGHAGYAAAAAAAKSLQADHLLQDLSVCHILGGGGGYLISEDLAFVLEW
jgi:hypothetical protein